MTRVPASVLGLLAAASVSACATTPADRSLPVFGSWTITDVREPGVTEARESEVAKWTGVKAAYARDRAAFGDASCAAPSYSVSLIDRATFEARYHATSEDAKLTGEPFTVISVRCSNEWAGPGSTLVVSGTRRLVSPWNGLLYELTRSD